MTDILRFEAGIWCPTFATIKAYRAGLLPAEEAQALERHRDACAECRVTFAVVPEGEPERVREELYERLRGLLKNPPPPGLPSVRLRHMEERYTQLRSRLVGTTNAAPDTPESGLQLVAGPAILPRLRARWEVVASKLLESLDHLGGSVLSFGSATVKEAGSKHDDEGSVGIIEGPSGGVAIRFPERMRGARWRCEVVPPGRRPQTVKQGVVSRGLTVRVAADALDEARSEGANLQVSILEQPER